MFEMDFSVWAKDMRDKVLRHIPEKDWKTIRVVIVTSVQYEKVIPLDPFAKERLLNPEASGDQSQTARTK